MTDPKLLKKQVADAKKYRGNEFTEINGYVKSVWSDLLCFPVGKIAGKPEDNVVFENSWMQSRTFGGDRGHEGTDIMASENVRGDVYKRQVFTMLDASTKVEWAKNQDGREVKDGDAVKKGQLLATVKGDVRVLLSGERTALNLSLIHICTNSMQTHLLHYIMVR